jgi:hypothetical protein
VHLAAKETTPERELGVGVASGRLLLGFLRRTGHFTIAGTAEVAGDGHLNFGRDLLSGHLDRRSEARNVPSLSSRVAFG